MFSRTNLSSFSSDVSSLVNGERMFNSCSSLTSFNSDLGVLKSGYYMFFDCNLDAESLRNIAYNINDLVEMGYDKNIDEHWTYEVLGETKTISSTYRGRIDIGYDESISEDVRIECGNILIDKGWRVYFNKKEFKK
jgi:hypothetical protein